MMTKAREEEGLESRPNGQQLVSQTLSAPTTWAGDGYRGAYPAAIDPETSGFVDLSLSSSNSGGFSRSESGSL